MDNPVCPNDGTEMRRGTRRTALNYKAHRTEVEMPGWYCDMCGEGIHSGHDLRVSDRALNRMKAAEDRLLLPEDIRRIRKKLKLAQTEAGEVIGGGPRAFQKYEAGDLLPSRGVSSALMLLDRDPMGISALRR